MDEVSQDQPQPEPPARLSGKVIGFRGWTLDGYRLLSANRQQHGGEWNLGPNKAECRIQERIKFLGGHDPRRATVESHDAPHPGCECGLYAYFSVRRDRNPHGFRVDDLIWGAVTAWGRVEVHAGGFRAEYAEPVALGYHPRQPYEDVVRAESFASEMGLPFVTLDELPGEAATHGAMIPEDLRPTGFMLGGDVAAVFRSMGVSMHQVAEQMAGMQAAQAAAQRVIIASRMRALISNEAFRTAGREKGIKQTLKTFGPPARGKWRVDDRVIDRRRDVWRCVKAGKPGTWELDETY